MRHVLCHLRTAVPESSRIPCRLLPLFLLRALRQDLQPRDCVGRAEVSRHSVPFTRLSDVRGRTFGADFGKHDRIIGRGERQRTARVVRFRHPPENYSSTGEVAVGDEIIALLKQRFDLVGIEWARRLLRLDGYSLHSGYGN